MYMSSTVCEAGVPLCDVSRIRIRWISSLAEARKLVIATGEWYWPEFYVAL